jgi:hypothetical protein
MPPRPPVTTRRPEVAAEVLASARGEGLVGALHDALGADVDPRAGGHLAVHRQAEGLEALVLGERRPLRDEQAVGEEHARRVLVGFKDALGAAALDEEGLVVAEVAEAGDDAVIVGPRASGLAGAAIDDEVGGVLGHVGVEVVHQHAEGGLLRPTLAGHG